MEKEKCFDMEPESLELIIIRHAETQYDNAGDRDGCDGDLTGRGEEQCVELGVKLKNVEIDGYFTSSLLRAFKTAAGVCKAKPDRPLLQIMPELIECGVPVGYYGCSAAYLQKHYSNAEMCENLFGTAEYAFGTKYAYNNELRAQKIIGYIKKTYTYGDRVVLFTHDGFSQYLIRTARNIEKQTFDFELNNTSLTTIGFLRNGQIILRGLNR